MNHGWLGILRGKKRKEAERRGKKLISPMSREKPPETEQSGT